MPPGQFQRRQRPQVSFERVTMTPGDHERMLFWDNDGNLFTDEELTEPTGLTIVRLGVGVDE